eukprot:70807-Pleurochrysis_carterae.AAC.1
MAACSFHMAACSFHMDACSLALSNSFSSHFACAVFPPTLALVCVGFTSFHDLLSYSSSLLPLFILCFSLSLPSLLSLIAFLSLLTHAALSLLSHAALSLSSAVVAHAQVTLKDF